MRVLRLGPERLFFSPASFSISHREGTALDSILILKAKKRGVSAPGLAAHDSIKRHWGLAHGSEGGSPEGHVPGN